MSRKHKHYGGIIGASPLDSNGALRPGVSNLGGISGDNAFEAPSLDLNFNGQASSGTGDDHFSDVVLLLNGDSATITDQSSNTGSNVSVGSGVGQSTTNVKHGSGSIQYSPNDSVNDNITATLPALSGDYTVEFFVYVGNPNNIALITDHRTTGTGGEHYPAIYYNTADNKIKYFAQSTDQIESSAISATTWTHVAVTRSGTTVTLFVDGVSQGTYSEGTTVQSLPSGTIYIGRRYQPNGTNYFSLRGNLDDLRITAGVARYTADFEPPTHKLPTAKEATALDQLATDIVTQNKGGTVQSKYMGPNGKLINGYVENLLPHSSIASWTQGQNMSVTASSVTDPFGGTGAYRIADLDTTTWRSMATTATVAANTWATLSVYIHASERTATQFGFNISYSGGATYPRLNIVNNGPPTTSNLQSGHSAYTGTVTQVAGTDWYRWEIPFDFGVTSIEYYPATSSASATGYTTVFGAQLELGGAASQLVQTSGASVAAQVPRVEFDASGNPLGLLVEEARTNYIGDSSDFSASGWVDGGAKVASDTSVTDPTGGSGAWTLREAPSATNFQALLLYQPYTPTAGEKTVFSVFARPITGANNELILTEWGEGYVSFNLNTGEVAYASGNETGQIIPAGNGWYRCIATITETNSAANGYFIIPGDGTFTSGSHVFNHSGGDVCHIFGAQVEVGESATSYIPTSGGTTATRTADDITLATSSFGYNTASGTTAVDFTMQGDTNATYPGIFTFIDDVAATNWPRDILYLDSANDNLNMFSRESTDTIWTIEAGVSFPLSRSVAIRIDGTSGRDAIDGTLSAAQTLDGAPSTTRDTLHVGSNGATNPMVGHIRRLIYWPRAINDASLIAYTGTNPPTELVARTTRRWGGMTGRSLVSGGNVPTTGVLSLAEDYQSKL